MKNHAIHYDDHTVCEVWPGLKNKSAHWMVD